jgi:hypothetical protein
LRTRKQDPVLSNHYMAQTLYMAEVRAGFNCGDSPDLRPPAVAILAEFGGGAEALDAEQQPFLELSAAQQEQILHSWPEVLAIANAVPSPDEWRLRLAEAGAPTRPSDLGLADADAYSD